MDREQNREQGCQVEVKCQGCESQRRCVVTRCVLPKSQMIRFVLAASGRIVPDLGERSPGRGWWVECKRLSLERAIRERRFARGTGQSVIVAADLPHRLAELLRERCLSWISLARRAGILAVGYRAAYETLNAYQESGKVWLVPHLLVVASDSLQVRTLQLSRLAGALPKIACFDARSLGQTLGQEVLYHLVMGQGRLAWRFARECDRFQSFAESSRLTDQASRCSVPRVGGSI